MITNKKWAVRLPGIAVVLAALTFGTTSAAQSAATGKSFLWKVQSGSKVLYLAGSVHALGADSYPLSAAYENAFKAAGTLVEEINLAEAEQMAAAPMLLAKGLYTDGVVCAPGRVLVERSVSKRGVPHPGGEILQRARSFRRVTPGERGFRLLYLSQEVFEEHRTGRVGGRGSWYSKEKGQR